MLHSWRIPIKWVKYLIESTVASKEEKGGSGCESSPRAEVVLTIGSQGKGKDDAKLDTVESWGEIGESMGYPTLATSPTAEGMNSGAVDESEVLAMAAIPLGTNWGADPLMALSVWLLIGVFSSVFPAGAAPSF
jgi:hypothetical protein